MDGYRGTERVFTRPSFNEELFSRLPQYSSDGVPSQSPVRAFGVAETGEKRAVLHASQSACRPRAARKIRARRRTWTLDRARPSARGSREEAVDTRKAARASLPL